MHFAVIFCVERYILCRDWCR